ncbi:MAG: tellurite resistance TerB family protein [Phycisphaerae bacterium]|nr:tellurite resistance TerB family protein [Phycisphaerae bacterium]
MGLFDGLKSKTTPTFDPQKAIMTIVIAAIKVDGNVSSEEVGYLRSMCARSPIFANNSKDEDDSVIDFALNVTDQLGMEAVQQAAGSLTEELRETAFAFATEMVLADGIVGDKEESFITELAEMLGVNRDLAHAIIEVTLIRGRGV